MWRYLRGQQGGYGVAEKHFGGGWELRVNRGGLEVEHGELKIFSFPVTFLDGLLDRLHLVLNEAI